LAEVMQIFGSRVWFQLLLSCLPVFNTLEMWVTLSWQVCSTAKSHVAEVVLLHE
jgi:hypothetical protein